PCGEACFSVLTEIPGEAYAVTLSGYSGASGDHLEKTAVHQGRQAQPWCRRDRQGQHQDVRGQPRSESPGSAAGSQGRLLPAAPLKTPLHPQNRDRVSSPRHSGSSRPGGSGGGSPPSPSSLRTVVPQRVLRLSPRTKLSPSLAGGVETSRGR